MADITTSIRVSDEMGKDIRSLKRETGIKTTSGLIEHFFKIGVAVHRKVSYFEEHPTELKELIGVTKKDLISDKIFEILEKQPLEVVKSIYMACELDLQQKRSKTMR